MELNGQRTPPPFYAEAKALGLVNLPEVTHMASLTFKDVVVFNDRMEARALFHGLVHAVQFEVLGVERYAELFVRGFLRRSSHFNVPLEKHAIELESRFAAGDKFSVEEVDAASFQVREIFTRREMMTADVCVTPYPRKDSNWPEFLISAKHPVEMIGPVEFVHGLSGGAATSHASSIDLYRMVHKQRCFELSVSETGTNADSSDPPLKTLTPVQQEKLRETMSDILHSFRFIQ